MTQRMRFCAYGVVIVVVGAAWFFSLCFFDRGRSPLKDMLIAQEEREELNRRHEVLVRRTQQRQRITNAVIAGRIDLDTAAAEFRKTDEGLTWVPPLDTEQSYQQVICCVHAELEGTELSQDKQNLLVSLDREYVRLFGHSPDLSARVDRVA